MAVYARNAELGTGKAGYYDVIPSFKSVQHLGGLLSGAKEMLDSHSEARPHSFRRRDCHLAVADTYGISFGIIDGCGERHALYRNHHPWLVP